MKKNIKDLIKSDRYERSKVRGQTTLSMAFSPLQQVRLSDYGTKKPI